MFASIFEPQTANVNSLKMPFQSNANLKNSRENRKILDSLLSKHFVDKTKAKFMMINGVRRKEEEK